MKEKYATRQYKPKVTRALALVALTGTLLASAGANQENANEARERAATPIEQTSNASEPNNDATKNDVLGAIESVAAVGTGIAAVGEIAELGAVAMRVRKESTERQAKPESHASS